LASEESLISAPVIIQQNIAWADATKRLPLTDKSVAIVYSSHMLEHLDREGALQFLAEAQRVLVNNGIIRLAVPDLRRRILQYLEHGDGDRFIGSLTMRSHNLRTIQDKIKMLLVGDRDHRWMYDAKSLSRLLNLNGFSNAAEVPPGVTHIEEPGELNLRDREDESIYVEARKGASQTSVMGTSGTLGA
jgi:predicted SAM-dependent methyltransferase